MKDHFNIKINLINLIKEKKILEKINSKKDLIKIKILAIETNLEIIKKEILKEEEILEKMIFS